MWLLEWAGSFAFRALVLSWGREKGVGLCTLIPPQSSHLWSNQLLNNAHTGDVNAELKKQSFPTTCTTRSALGGWSDGMLMSNEM